jgi:hypothetical protein
MKCPRMVLLILGWICSIYPASAQPIDPALEGWMRLPENPAMREACMPDLLYGTSIISMFNRHATAIEVLRWQEREAEKTVTENPTMDAFDAGIGSLMTMTTLITHARFDGQIYNDIPGGFPQWAYRSCLKGKSLE